jgi:hypothetical protein
VQDNYIILNLDEAKYLAHIRAKMD